MTPFKITGPAVISFSGGRTSALMLARIAEQGFRPDVHVLYANTGKEREETLRFVHAVGEHLGVSVRWLERAPDGSVREVTFETAARQGEPFEALITKRKFLPNPVTRYCTQELKIRVMKRWMVARGYKNWTNVVGLRADEPHRVAKQRAKEGKERWDLAFPLFDAGVTKADVILHWKKQPFDLQLKSWEGNCDLCFLKGVAKRTRIIEDDPNRAEWWAAQEQRIGGTFRSDTADYAGLARLAQQQGRLFDNALFNAEADEFSDPTDLDECGGYCESNREAA